MIMMGAIASARAWAIEAETRAESLKELLVTYEKINDKYINLLKEAIVDKNIIEELKTELEDGRYELVGVRYELEEARYELFLKAHRKQEQDLEQELEYS
jgi:pheromone shutdown protein TraB